MTAQFTEHDMKSIIEQIDGLVVALNRDNDNRDNIKFQEHMEDLVYILNAYLAD